MEEEEFPGARSLVARGSVLSSLSTHTVGFLSHWFPALQQCFSLREPESMHETANEIKPCVKQLKALMLCSFKEQWAEAN